MKKLSLSVATLIALSSTTLLADTASELAELRAEIQELKEQTSVLIDETSDLKTGFNYTTVDTTKAYSGLGAAASKVYYSKSPLSIGGYGEMYHARKSDGSSATDVYRFVPYIGYKFSDSIILNTEIEFEHGGVANDGGAAKGGEVIVEFMYLDFLLNQHANVRVGNFLVPMGLINERHEPTLFTTVQRPGTAKYLIPSTWHESGAMVYGDIIAGLEYKFAAISALKTGDNGSKWIRGGRTGSFKSSNPNLAYVARLDYTGTNGLLVGGSAYYGVANDAVTSDMIMFDVHFDYNLAGFRTYGTYTAVNRSDANQFNSTNTDGSTNFAVESGNGGYINIGFDVLSLTQIDKKMPIFVQYETLNQQAKIADGSTNDAANTTTVGVNYFPHDQVVLKMDYAMAKAATGGNTDYTTSISMGFIF
jgi:hypothetical protein